ncbi:MAG: (4Fe-4S)-binding protein [Bacteroidales bacterium]|nr:(4Fe-4S)-binding protein [Bacteroidales bacterium]MCB9013142.1 (4Fe-4S)-binding protein [Bacteroidales bacterium]
MSQNDRKYTNGEITVYWKPSKCIHATTCFRELIEVFNPRKRPWVNMQGAPSNRITEVVDKCPTQAIFWKYNKDIPESELTTDLHSGEEVTPEDILNQQKEEEAVVGANISVMRNGPLLVEGDFKIIGPEGNELKTMIMTSFCRCGHSRAQPFCDGTHRKFGFQG